MKIERPKEQYLVPIKELEPGDQFRERSSFLSPLMTIIEIKDGKIYTQSRVTAYGWTTLESVYVSEELYRQIRLCSILKQLCNSMPYKSMIEDAKEVEFPSTFVKQMVHSARVRFDNIRGIESLYWVPEASLPMITGYAYDAGYNQAVKDRHQGEEKVQEKWDDFIGIPI